MDGGFIWIYKKYMDVDGSFIMSYSAYSEVGIIFFCPVITLTII